ncbi:hypothetical protein [Nostoc sp.]
MFSIELSDCKDNWSESSRKAAAAGRWLSSLTVELLHTKIPQVSDRPSG